MYEPTQKARLRDSPEEQRTLELMALKSDRATRLLKQNKLNPNVRESTRYEIGDLVLVARGNALTITTKWPAFSSKYYGPCEVVTARHPRYSLRSQHGRYTRSNVHARRLCLYISR